MSRKDQVLKSSATRDVRYFLLHFDSPNNTHDKNPEAPLPENPTLDLVHESLEENELYRMVTLEEVLTQSKSMELNPGETLASAYENSLDEEDNLIGERNEQTITEEVFKERKAVIIHKRNRLVAEMYKRMLDTIAKDVAQKRDDDERKRLELQDKEEEAIRRDKKDKNKRPSSNVKNTRPKSGKNSKKPTKEELEEQKKLEEEEAAREREKEEEEQREWLAHKEAQKKEYEESRKVELSEREQGLRPSVYIVLRNYPETLDELEAIREAGANFDALVVLNSENREGPPPKTDAEIEDALDSKNKDNKKKKGNAPARPKSKQEPKARPKSVLNAKKKAPAKGDKKKSAPTIPIEYEKYPPLYVALTEKQEKLRENNVASPLRDILVLHHKVYDYTYDETTKQFDDGEDVNQEVTRVVTNITETIPKLLSKIPTYRDDPEYKNNSNLVFVSGTEDTEPDTAYYRKLLQDVPEICMTVPVLVHCLIEQVVRSAEQHVEFTNEKHTVIEDLKLVEFDERINSVLDGVFAKFYNPEDHQEKENPFEITHPQVLLLPYGNRTSENSIHNCSIQDVPLTKIENKMNRLFPVFYNVSSDNEVTPGDETQPPPIHSTEDRGIRLTELYHFMCSNPNGDTVQNRYLYSTEQMEKELCLFQFEKMLPGSNFGDRIVREDFDSETFVQVLTGLSILDEPELISNYYDMEDAMLILCYRKIPQCRFVQDSWYKTFAIRPYFMESQLEEAKELVLEHYRQYEKRYKETAAKVQQVLQNTDPNAQPPPVPQQTEPNVQPVVTPPKRTRLEEGDSRYVMEGTGSQVNVDYIQFYVGDGATMHLTYQETNTQKLACNVQKDGVVFGWKTNIQSNQTYFSAVFEDHSVLLVQQLEQTRLCYATADGLLLEFCSDGNLYQSFPGANEWAEHSKKVFGIGYQGLVQNKADQMTVKMAAIIETLQVWDLKTNTTKTILTREQCRCITPSGDVIRYFENDITQVMCVDGQVHVLYEGCWLSKLNNGQVTIESENVKKVVGTILFAKNVDPDTRATVHSREDLVMRVEYGENIWLVQHADGTRIWNISDTIYVKKDNYATVKIEKTGQSAECPDSTIIKCTPSTNFVMFKQGHYINVDVSETMLLFEPSSLAFVTKRAPSRKSRVNVPGVYNFNYATGGVKTLDIQGHEFTVTSTGASLICFKGVKSGLSTQEGPITGLPPVQVQGELPVDEYAFPPRLFLLRRSDGSGSEFLSSNDVEPYIRTARASEQTSITEDKFGEMKNISTISFMTQYQRTIKESLLGNPEATYTIPRTITPLYDSQTDQSNGPETVLHYRKLIQYPVLQDSDREHMKHGYQQWVDWHNQRETYNNQLQLNEPTSEQDPTQELIKQRIKELVERKQQESSQPPSEQVKEQETEEDEPDNTIIDKIRTQSRAALSKSVEPETTSRPLYWQDKQGRKALEKLEQNPRASALPEPRYRQSVPTSVQNSRPITHESSVVNDSIIEDDTQDESIIEDDFESNGGGQDVSKITLKQLKKHQIENTATFVVNEEYKRIEGDLRRKVNTVSTSMNVPDENQVHVDGPILRIYPAMVTFGHLPVGEVYSASVMITNYGNLPGRFHVKHLNKSTWFNSQRDARENSSMKVHCQKGPLAPGMSVKIEFEIHAVKPQKLAYDVEITTEQHVITLPVTATVVSKHQFSSEKYQLNKRIRISTPTPTVHQIK